MIALIVIMILLAACTLLIGYGSCVVAGRADEAEEREREKERKK